MLCQTKFIELKDKATFTQNFGTPVWNQNALVFVWPIYLLILFMRKFVPFIICAQQIRPISFEFR
jgi:hypothetical protein